MSRRERPSLVVESSQRAVTFQALAKRCAGNPKKLRGPDLIAVRLAHRPQGKFPLEPGQQLDAGELVGERMLPARATVTVEGLPQEIVVTGEIQLS